MKSVMWWTMGPLVFLTVYFAIALSIFSFVYPKLPRLDFIENRHASRILNKWIRYWWMWVTNPIFKLFLRFKIKPNTISFVGTLFGFLSGLAFAFADRWVGVGSFLLGGWLMVFGGSFDLFDGRVARATQQESLAGAFFDSVMDRISECAVFSGIAYYYRTSWIFWLVMAAFTGAMMTSYSKCRGDKMGVTYEGGMMQRPERVVYTGVGAIFTPVIGYVLLYFFPESFTDITATANAVYAAPLLFVAVFTNVTTVDRMKNIMKLLDAKEGKSR